MKTSKKKKIIIQSLNESNIKYHGTTETDPGAQKSIEKVQNNATGSLDTLQNTKKQRTEMPNGEEKKKLTNKNKIFNSSQYLEPQKLHTQLSASETQHNTTHILIITQGSILQISKLNPDPKSPKKEEKKNSNFSM